MKYLKNFKLFENFKKFSEKLENSNYIIENKLNENEELMNSYLLYIIYIFKKIKEKDLFDIIKDENKLIENNIIIPDHILKVWLKDDFDFNKSIKILIGDKMIEKNYNYIIITEKGQNKFEFEKNVSNSIIHNVIWRFFASYQAGKKKSNFDWWNKWSVTPGQTLWHTDLNKYLGQKGKYFPNVNEMTLYRGINIKIKDNKELYQKIKNREIKIGDFIDNNKNISWTHSLNVARSFAIGRKNLFKYKLLQPDEFGVILKHTFKSNEILLDINWLMKNDEEWKHEDDTEMEVIVSPVKRKVEIFEMFDKEYFKKYLSDDFNNFIIKEINGGANSMYIDKRELDLNKLKFELESFRREKEIKHEWKNYKDITNDLKIYLNKLGYPAVKTNGYYYNADNNYLPNMNNWTPEFREKYLKYRKKNNNNVNGLPHNHQWVIIINSLKEEKNKNDEFLIKDFYIIDLTEDQFHPGKEKEYRIGIYKIPNINYDSYLRWRYIK
jgi:hypothetical protein